MRLFFAGIASLAASASAQQLLVFGDNALPSCAQQCAELQNAQSGCLPPAAPVTDATIYESCFCQSGYLSTLKAAGSTLCSSVCGAQDLPKISSWYQSNCADNGVAAAAALGTRIATATQTSISASATATFSTSSTNGASSSSASNNSNNNSNTVQRSWWDSHYKWIVMLIVIFIGFALLTVLLVWLRRRHHRRQDLAHAPFNSGITHHSIPALTSTLAPVGKTASRSSLPRVREKDRMQVMSQPLPPIPQSPEMRFTSDVERGNGKRPVY